MERVDVDVDRLSNDDWAEQKELQRIYEEKIMNANTEIPGSVGKDDVIIYLTPHEFDKLCSFIDLFAYN